MCVCVCVKYVKRGRAREIIRNNKITTRNKKKHQEIIKLLIVQYQDVLFPSSIVSVRMRS